MIKYTGLCTCAFPKFYMVIANALDALGSTQFSWITDLPNKGCCRRILFCLFCITADMQSKSVEK